MSAAEIVGDKPQRRRRTAFTRHQLDQMEATFRRDKYPGIDTRDRLSNDLGVSEKRLQVWFQNRRSRWRKNEQKNSASSSEAPVSFNDTVSRPLGPINGPRGATWSPPLATHPLVSGPPTYTSSNDVPSYIGLRRFDTPSYLIASVSSVLSKDNAGHPVVIKVEATAHAQMDGKVAQLPIGPRGHARRGARRSLDEVLAAETLVSVSQHGGASE